MPELHAVPSRTHRIVPIRFARAVEGLPDPDAPDLDDRGFLSGERSPARGPCVGIPAGASIRVRVIRDRISRAAPLFVTAEDRTIVAPLEARVGDELRLQASRAITTMEWTRVQVRYGTVTGPVLAELSVRVYAKLIVPVVCHRVTIDGIAPAAVDVPGLFAEVNRTFAQAGIEFCPRRGPLVREERLEGTAEAGAATIDDLPSILALHPAEGALNAYFIPRFGGGLGLAGVAIGREVSEERRGARTGIILQDLPLRELTVHTLGHEIGHILGLAHYGDGTGFAEDLWAHRNLMYEVIVLHTEADGNWPHDCRSTPARREIGYGTVGPVPRAGRWLGSRRLDRIRQGEQILIARSAVRRRRYAP